MILIYSIMEKETLKHESFGQISFSRVCGSANFYGSELKQDNYITMEVSSSEIQRELTKDWYFTSGIPIIKLRMSSGQFSEMITSMNIGSGVCCTVERLGVKKMEEMPVQESRKEFVHRKFKDRMKSFTNELVEKQQRAKDLIKKKTLSKKDQEELNFILERLTQEVSNNIPFFAECFQENMDEVVHEAKLEVENAIQHKINILGLDALHEQNKLLGE